MRKDNTFEIIEGTVKKILAEINGKLTDIAFYFDEKEHRYIILHNFSDRFFTDDTFAAKVSDILYERLDLNGITNYDFYEDNSALSILTKNYTERKHSSQGECLFNSAYEEKEIEKYTIVKSNVTSADVSWLIPVA